MNLLNGKFDKALSIQSEALSLFQQIDEQHEQASCIVLGAEITWRKKDSDKALEMGNEGLELARRVKDSNAESYAIELLALIYKEQEALALPQQTTQLAVEGGGAGPDMAQSIVKEKGEYAGPTANELRPRVLELAVQCVGEGDLAADMPLMEAGLDSLAMVQFRNTLMGTYQGVSMPASLIFDHPSVAAISSYIEGELKDVHERS